ncbi:MAG: hypothetical protein QG670_1426 [Thermoproteota archaeon]|nr:hypothetical protein [Thermoproteota archaeon]
MIARAKHWDEWKSQGSVTGEFKPVKLGFGTVHSYIPRSPLWMFLGEATSELQFI